MSATTTVQPILKLRTSENPTWNSKSDGIMAHAELSAIEALAADDWRATLLRDGYVVIKNAIPRDRGVAYGDGIRDIFTSFGTPLDFNNRSTWKKEYFPDPTKINTYTTHCIPHEKAVWDVRRDKDIRSYFEKLWGTNELLVSFDAVNVTFPGHQSAGFWPHFDQSPFREGLQCVQGLVPLSDAGPKDGGLVVYKGSNRLYRKFFDESDKEDKTKWRKLDSVKLSEEEMKWFMDRECEEIKINCEVGDLVLWDSRTVHFGKEPDVDSDIVRTVVYVCYTPAMWATEEDLKLKKETFEQYKNTSHWPHTNIESGFDPVVPSGNVAVRTEPLNKAHLDDPEVLKLAGVEPY